MKMFSFKKYDKITNTYDNKHVKGVKMALESQNIEDLWLITEKIHGANFASYVKGNDDYMDDSIYLYQYASRNNLLTDNESDAFYNFKSIKDETTVKMCELYKSIYDGSIKVVEEIIVYGELFGGGYEHSEVPKLNQSRVQKGVQYCPDLHFKVFDIYIRYDDSSNEFMNPAYLNKICYDVGVDRIVPRFHGTLDECIAYENDFDSGIYLDYDLPSVGVNVCEGVVIKPIEPFYDNRGNRAIFKNKNDKFKEIAGERKNKVRKVVELSDEDQEQFNLIDRYVTMNRLNNLESKIGELEEAKQIGQFIKGMSLDVIEDLKYEMDVELDKPARGYLSKASKILIMEKLYG